MTDQLLNDLLPAWHPDFQLERNPDVLSFPKAWHVKRDMTRDGLSDNLTESEAEKNPGQPFFQSCQM